MAQNVGILDLSKAEKATTWLLAFGALARTKKWIDTVAIAADEATNTPATTSDLQITDNFISRCGLDALEKTQYIVAPHKIHDLTFASINKALQTYLCPRTKLIIAERANFHGIKQIKGESAMDFTSRLRKAVQFCNFDDLKNSNDPTEEMILVALIAGLENFDQKEKVLNMFQTNNTLSVVQVIEQIQQMEQVKSFVKNDTHTSIESSVSNVEVHFQHGIKKINDCKFCGSSHLIRKCPAYGKICSFCKKVNHFAVVCKSKKGIKGTHVHALDALDNQNQHDSRDDCLFLSPAKTELMANIWIKMEKSIGKSIGKSKRK
jgi:hypothetical protein